MRKTRVVLDPVAGHFNFEVPYTNRFDQPLNGMYIQELNGIDFPRVAHPRMQLRPEYLVDGGRVAPVSKGRQVPELDVVNKPEPTVTRTVSAAPTKFKTAAQQRQFYQNAMKPAVVKNPRPKPAVASPKEDLKSPGQKAFLTAKDIAVVNPKTPKPQNPKTPDYTNYIENKLLQKWVIPVSELTKTKKKQRLTYLQFKVT